MKCQVHNYIQEQISAQKKDKHKHKIDEKNIMTLHSPYIEFANTIVGVGYFVCVDLWFMCTCAHVP